MIRRAGAAAALLLMLSAAEELPTPLAERVAVIGAGPAGLSAAVTAAQRGHILLHIESGFLGCGGNPVIFKATTIIKGTAACRARSLFF